MQNAGKKRYFFLNSYVCDGTTAFGVENFQLIAAHICEHGYKPMNGCCVENITRAENPEEGLAKKFDFFKIPDQITQATPELKKLCRHHEPIEASCRECNIGFYVMLKAKYIAYNTVGFYRPNRNA